MSTVPGAWAFWVAWHLLLPWASRRLPRCPSLGLREQAASPAALPLTSSLTPGTLLDAHLHSPVSCKVKKWINSMTSTVPASPLRDPPTPLLSLSSFCRTPSGETSCTMKPRKGPQPCLPNADGLHALRDPLDSAACALTSESRVHLPLPRMRMDDIKERAYALRKEGPLCVHSLNHWR